MIGCDHGCSLVGSLGNCLGIAVARSFIVASETHPRFHSLSGRFDFDVGFVGVIICVGFRLWRLALDPRTNMLLPLLLLLRRLFVVRHDRWIYVLVDSFASVGLLVCEQV